MTGQIEDRLVKERAERAFLSAIRRSIGVLSIVRCDVKNRNGYQEGDCDAGKDSQPELDI